MWPKNWNSHDTLGIEHGSKVIKMPLRSFGGFTSPSHTSDHLLEEVRRTENERGKNHGGEGCGQGYTHTHSTLNTSYWLFTMVYLQHELSSQIKTKTEIIPGGPWKRTPLGGAILNFSNTSGYTSGNKTISFNALICLFRPPTASNITLKYSTVDVNHKCIELDTSLLIF